MKAIASCLLALLSGFASAAACGGETDADRCVTGAVRAAGDDCNLCTCTAGAWSCSTDVCVRPECPPMAPMPDECPGDNWVRQSETGGCCRYEFACAGPGPDWISFYSSQVACETVRLPHCEAGVSVPAGDGCNECTCSEDGSLWTCTDDVCPGSSEGSGKACGYWEGGCPAGEYCAFEPVEACSSFDAPSVCRSIPEHCDASDAEVCGCDGKTYGNRCLAAQAGVGIRDVGVCPTVREDRWCGADAGVTCAADEYCAYSPAGASLPGGAVSACGDDGAQARCEVRPRACVNQYSPVCGCDRKSYRNACYAAMAGTGVRAPGLCGS